MKFECYSNPFELIDSWNLKKFKTIFAHYVNSFNYDDIADKEGFKEIESAYYVASDLLDDIAEILNSRPDVS